MSVIQKERKQAISAGCDALERFYAEVVAKDSWTVKSVGLR